MTTFGSTSRWRLRPVRPLRPIDVAALNRSFLGPLERAVTTPPAGH